MFPKGSWRATLTFVALLGALGAVILGGGVGAQILAVRQLGTPVADLPRVQQTGSPYLVAPPAEKTRAIPRRPPAATSVARTRTRVAVTNGPTSWTQLNQAIARIPNYRPGVATWVVSGRYGHWGATDLSNGRIYISPNVPAFRVYDVASHEYAHALAAYDYGWNTRSADLAVSRWFGGGTPAARERAADCMAIAQGATWTNNTSCQNEHWREGSRVLLAAHRLP